MKTIEKNHLMLYNKKYNIGGVFVDRITQSMMDAFKVDLNIGINDASPLFECFSNYCVVNNVYGLNDFDVEDITTGTATQGIDGIAIIVNQKLINTTDDIDLLSNYISKIHFNPD